MFDLDEYRNRISRKRIAENKLLLDLMRIKWPDLKDSTSIVIVEDNPHNGIKLKEYDVAANGRHYVFTAARHTPSDIFPECEMVYLLLSRIKWNRRGDRKLITEYIPVSQNAG